MAEFVELSVKDYIARVVINRPDVHNAFNEVMIQELISTFNDLSDRDDVRVVILSTVGKSFCAGADLKWMRKMADYTFDENIEDAQWLADMLYSIRSCRKPVIGRVHGSAYGGGVGLISACDIALSLDNVIFCLSEVKLGLLPAVISPFVLEKIGTAAASRYFLSAEKFDVAEAKLMGLIADSFATEEELDATVERIASNIIKNAPDAVVACKTMIRQVMGADWETAKEVTSRLIAERRVSTEGQEGIRAFLDKRKPNWLMETVS